MSLSGHYKCRCSPVLTVQPSPSEGQAGRNTARLLRWGVTGARNPHSKGSSRPLFIARAKMVHRLPSFWRASRQWRCLIPANGFYEWSKDESGSRTPVWFLLNYEAPWRSPESDLQNNWKMGESLPAPQSPARQNNLVAPVHYRMPVMLPWDRYWELIHPQADVEDLNCLT